MTVLADALRMLARRDFSVVQLRARLIDRGHAAAEVEEAIEHLLEEGSLNDRRVAAEYARRALRVKGRGRLRVQRELTEMGIAREVAQEAVAEAFGEVDERALIRQALQKKLRGQARVISRPEQARLYQFLLRQGFTPGAVTAALRAYGRLDPDDE